MIVPYDRSVNPRLARVVPVRNRVLPPRDQERPTSASFSADDAAFGEMPILLGSYPAGGGSGVSPAALEDAERRCHRWERALRVACFFVPPALVLKAVCRYRKAVSR